MERVADELDNVHEPLLETAKYLVVAPLPQEPLHVYDNTFLELDQEVV
jgi:hypothetical protein